MLAVAALVALVAQDPAPPPARTVAQDCDAALAQLVDAPTREARRALAAKLARAGPNDPGAWSAAMQRFGSFEPVKAGVRVENVDFLVQGKHETTELWVYVPPGYDPTQPAPLMLAFHGTGGSGKGMHTLWQKTADELGMLVLCPSEAGPNDGYHFDDRERDSALAALRWMRRHHNVDENRVYASGISRGGHLTWDLALRHPGIFAAIVPCIGSPRLTVIAGQNNLRLLENVATLPIRDLQGAKDDPGLVKSIRFAFELLGRFAPRDAKLIEFPELGHDFEMTAVDWSAWLRACVRDPAPERIAHCTATKDEGRSSWLEITGFAKDVRETFRLEVQEGEWARLDEAGQWRRVMSEAVQRNARATVRRTGPGLFTVELDGATKVRLSLREADIGPGGKVAISLGGKLLERSAKTDVKAMLEDFAETFDRTFVTRAQVEVP